MTVTVKPESRDAAVASTLDEIAKFLDRADARELEEEKSSRSGSSGGPRLQRRIAQALDAAVYYGLGVEYLDRFPSLVESITRDEADAAFRERVHPDRFTIASAGSF